MAKFKIEPDIQTRVDQEFPSQLLYISPPEADNLKTWLRNLDEGHSASAAEVNHLANGTPAKK